MLIVSSICLCAVKPVATAQKEVCQQERTKYHKTVIVLTILCLIISIIGLLFKRYNILMSLSVGLSLANVLLILGKMRCLKIIKIHLIRHENQDVNVLGAHETFM